MSLLVSGDEVHRGDATFVEKDYEVRRGDSSAEVAPEGNSIIPSQSDKRRDALELLYP